MGWSVCEGLIPSLLGPIGGGGGWLVVTRDTTNTVRNPAVADAGVHWAL